MRKQETVTIEFDDKKREVGWPLDRPLSVTVPKRRIAVVQNPRSPFHGELVYGGRQLFSLDGIVAMLAEQSQWENLDYFAAAKRGWVMYSVAERLAELLPDSGVRAEARRAADVARHLHSARDEHKVLARNRAGQVGTLSEPGYESQTTGAAAAEQAGDELMTRAYKAGRIAGIARRDLRSMRETVETFTRRANQTVELLRNQPDAETLRNSFELAAPGFYKPWTYLRQVDQKLRQVGYSFNQPDYALRLADCLELEGSVFWLTSPSRRLQYDSLTKLRTNRHQLAASLDQRLRYLRGFRHLLVPYERLVEDVRGQLQLCRDAVAESETSKVDFGALTVARVAAKQANRLLRYRTVNDRLWYRT